MEVPEPKAKRLRTIVWTITLALLGLAAVAWAGWLDLELAGDWRNWIVPVVMFAPTALVTVLALASRRRASRVVGFLTVALVIFVVRVPWTPRKLFVMRLHSIDEGMGVDEVEAIMAGYVKGNGWATPDMPPLPMLGPGEQHSPQAIEAVEQSVRDAQARYESPEYPEGEERAHATGTMIYRWNTTDSSYNADWGIVEFKDGKVVAVTFSPD
jgi:hypothetical protein